MRVLVTGGTGYVGSHTIAALVARGHEPRLLAREPDAAAAVLAPLGCSDVEVVGGDVTDAASVRAAVEGCAAVVHCAAVFSFDSARARDIRSTNVAGTEIVLEAARAEGCDPIVHMSSYLGMLPADGVLTADSPLRDSGYPYAQSKADSERVARRLQSEGVPVVSVLSGWVWGPLDPRLGESSQMIGNLLRGFMRLVPPGRGSVVDVRDLAALLASLIEPGAGPRRLMASGTSTTFEELARILGEVTGRSIPVTVIPAAMASIAGASADVLRVLGPRLPANREGTWVYVNGPRADDGPAWSQAGIERRPLAETLADQVRWMQEQGHLGGSPGAVERSKR